MAMLVLHVEVPFSELFHGELQTRTGTLIPGGTFYDLFLVLIFGCISGKMLLYSVVSRLVIYKICFTFDLDIWMYWCQNDSSLARDVSYWLKLWWRHHFPSYWHFVGESTGHRWSPLTKASDAELWYLFDVRLNKCLSKQTRCRRLETPWCSLWRHSNVNHAADGRIIGILLRYDVASVTGPLLVNLTAWIPNGAQHCVYTRLEIINIATRVWAVWLLQTL